MALKKAQRMQVLSWIAAGMRADEIKARASKFDPPFTLTRQAINYYRRTRKIDIEEIKKESEHRALNEGLAIKTNRVELLKNLAWLLENDLFLKDKLWTNEVKGIGSGDNYEKINYKEFNTAEVAQLRGVLDDIAQEMGHRAKKLEHSGPDGEPIPVSMIEVILPPDED